MSSDSIGIANGTKIATDAVSEGGETRHRQRVIVDQGLEVSNNALLPTDILAAHLSNDTHGHDMNKAGSLESPLAYRYTVPTGKVARIHFISGEIVMTAGQWSPVNFAGLGDALTNGLTVKIFDADDTELFDFTDEDPITTNADWADLLGAAAFTDIANVDMIAIEWRIAAQYGGPIFLTAGQYMQVLVQDDLSSILTFHMGVHGAEVAA
jgi:hypothetical protein